MTEKFLTAFVSDLRHTHEIAVLAGDTDSVDALGHLLGEIEAGAVAGGSAVALRVRFDAWLDASPCRREIWNDNRLALDGLI